MHRKLFLLSLTLFITSAAFAQSPRDIETDLLKLFTKIEPQGLDYGKANKLFAQKLKYYTERYPSTIGQNFKQLRKNYVDISTSTDGLFRIYSWDTETGGSMHFFESVFQYNSRGRIKSEIDTSKELYDNRPNYSKLYTFRANGKTYYLSLYTYIWSSKDIWDGMQVFNIENGKLNRDVKIIKTRTGLHNKINIEYDFWSVVDWKVRPVIRFDSNTKTIFIPLVDEEGKVTHKFITYKFNGQYFEKVKS